jgi:hypothetical protein
MIALSDVEVTRRRAGIEVRGGSAFAGGYPSTPETLNETNDLPFMFEFYGYEAPLRAWLTGLYVTGFAHGHALRLALKAASVAAFDASNEDDVIEACLARGWLRPTVYSPREAWSVNMGTTTVNWSGWGFEPAGDLRAWLQGARLPALGCPLKQAAYDGRCLGARFRAAEIQASERWLDHVIVRIVDEADEDDLSLREILSEAELWPSIAGVTMRDVETGVARLKQRGELVDSVVTPKNRPTQLDLLEAAQ